MQQSIAHIALLVRDYDDALDFYVRKLRFRLIEDTYQPAQDKRWVVIAPPGAAATSLLLARASSPAQEALIGNQAGGRVFLFLQTDDCQKTYEEFSSRGVEFQEAPEQRPYGIDAGFRDPSGNNFRLTEVTPMP